MQPIIICETDRLRKRTSQGRGYYFDDYFNTKRIRLENCSNSIYRYSRQVTGFIWPSNWWNDNCYGKFISHENQQLDSFNRRWIFFKVPRNRKLRDVIFISDPKKIKLENEFRAVTNGVTPVQVSNRFQAGCSDFSVTIQEGYKLNLTLISWSKTKRQINLFPKEKSRIQTRSKSEKTISGYGRGW